MPIEKPRSSAKPIEPIEECEENAAKAKRFKFEFS